MWSTYGLTTFYKALAAAVCAVMGIICFGTPFIFDCMSIIFFIVAIAIFKSNINIVGVCLILIVENIIINTYYSLYIPSFEVSSILQTTPISVSNPLYFSFTDSAFWRVFGYQAVAVSLLFVWHDKLSRLVAMLLIACVASEIYWTAIDYQGPNLHFYLIKACIYLYVRKFLLLRPHYSAESWRSEMQILRLDWFVTKTMALSIIFECSMIIEYLIRHTTQFKPIFIYQLYEYFMQAIGVWILWLVVREAIKLSNQKKLAA